MMFRRSRRNSYSTYIGRQNGGLTGDSQLRTWDCNDCHFASSSGGAQAKGTRGILSRSRGIGVPFALIVRADKDRLVLREAIGERGHVELPFWWLQEFREAWKSGITLAVLGFWKLWKVQVVICTFMIAAEHLCQLMLTSISGV